MIVHCPKCHFSQPDDQYCAQCGVNMKTYRAPKPPILSRILASTSFQITLVVAIGAGATFFILKQTKVVSAIAARGFTSQKIKSSAFGSRDATENQKIETASTAPAAAPPATHETPPETVPVIVAGETTAAAFAPTAVKSGDATTAKSASADKKDGNPVPLLNPKQVKIIYAEITARGYEVLTEESKSSGQFNSFADYSAGVVPRLNKRLALIPRDFKVISTEVINIDGSKPLQANLNYGDRNREPASMAMQFSTAVHLDGGDGGTRAEVEVLKVTNKGERANYPMGFDVMTDTGYFISGLHHGKSSTDAERTFDSELVVLVEFPR